MHDVPGRKGGVGGLEHHVPRARIVVPAGPRLDIHRAQLPLAKRVVAARGKPAGLLLLTDLQPELYELNAAVHHEPLDGRAVLEEALVLLLGAKTHDVLDAGAVVPAAIENDDLA